MIIQFPSFVIKNMIAINSFIMDLFWFVSKAQITVKEICQARKSSIKPMVAL